MREEGTIEMARPKNRTSSLYFNYPQFPFIRAPELDGKSQQYPVVVVGAGPIGVTAALELARSGGEDYELCMVASPGALGPVAEAFEDRFGIPLTLVGHVEDGDGVRFQGGGDGGRTATGGFDHFVPEDAPC